MKRTLLLSALIAVTMTACGKKEEAAAPAPSAPTAGPAQAQSEPAAQPAAPAAEATAPAEKKPEEKK